MLATTANRKTKSSESALSSGATNSQFLRRGEKLVGEGKGKRLEDKEKTEKEGRKQTESNEGEQA